MNKQVLTRVVALRARQAALRILDACTVAGVDVSISGKKTTATSVEFIVRPTGKDSSEEAMKKFTAIAKPISEEHNWCKLDGVVVTQVGFELPKADNKVAPKPAQEEVKDGKK